MPRQNIPVNKRVMRAPFVNRISALQRAILTELVLSDWRHPDSRRRSGALPIHRLRSIFGVPSTARFARLTASQRASLSRSLRRLEQAGFIDQRYGAFSAAITRAGRRALAEPEPGSRGLQKRRARRVMSLRISRTVCGGCGQDVAIRSGAIHPDTDPDGFFERLQVEALIKSGIPVVDDVSEDHIQPRCPHCGATVKREAGK